MPTYVFTYRQPTELVPADPGESMAAWQSYFDDIAPRVVDMGRPVVERRSVGETGADTQLGGYSVIEADDIESALQLAKASPAVTFGGGVEVGELRDLPQEVIDRFAARAAQR